MLRSLYSFKATYPAALSFAEGEAFLELDTTKSDRNWYYVTSSSGRPGFVPRNYMTEAPATPEERAAHGSQVLVALANNPSVPNKERAEVEARLGALASRPDSLSMPSTSMLRSQGSKDSLSSIRSSKKRAAPPPPSGQQANRSSSECSREGRDTSLEPREASLEPRESSLEPREASPGPSISPSMREIAVSSPSPRSSPRPSACSMDTATTAETIPEDSPRTQTQDSGPPQVVTVTYRQQQDSCHGQALEMVELIRSEAGISHSASQTLLQHLLASLVATQRDLNVLVPSLSSELSQALYHSKSEIHESQDYHKLTQLLDELTKAKEDDQQRNWMLYEDEASIIDNLSAVCSTLQGADRQICCAALSRWKYQAVQSLVEYHQMETRWSIRKILIETFTMMCSIDQPIISLMLSSVLPLEVAQDMFENSEDVERLKHSSIILTILFSQGESVPILYLEQQLGTSLINFVLAKIESQPEQDTDEEIADCFMGLLASYNLQFSRTQDNIVLQCLSTTNNAKTFTEKLLLLLNREDDPAAIIGTREGEVNSIHKLVLDVFSIEGCIRHFYTNDLMVLIDIIARQLADLGPGLLRYTYLEMAHLVLVKSGYDEHLHRLADLKVCLHRIQKEEGDTIDKTKVSEICDSFACFQI